MPPYGIDTLLNRNFDAQGFFESPAESIYDPAFGTLNYQTAYGPAPYTGNIPLTSYRVQPGIENLGFQGDLELPSFGGSGNPRFNQFGKDIDFINAPQDIYPEAVPPDFINAPQDIYPPNLTSTKGLPTLDLQNLPANMGVANEQDVEQVDSLTGQKKSGGILDLIMSIAVPGYGFLKNIGKGGLEGIRGLNQRIQQSDFGRSKTLADYFDARRYGGRDARDAAAARNMAQARGITKSLASRPSSTSGGYQKGPGGSGAQRTGASKSQSQAGPGFSGSGSAAEMGSF